MMRTENGEIIDPTSYGNVARFINHSCDPNCETRKWTVGKETSVGIFARRNIEEDEELTFDYQFDTFKTPFTKCYCGTHKCKGYLGLAVYDQGEDNVNAPICHICKDLVEKKEYLVVCKGSCEQVFHFECVKEGSYMKVDRNSYFCKPCARINNKAMRKQRLRQEVEEINNSDDDNLPDEERKGANEGDVDMQCETPAGNSSNQGSPVKRGRPKGSGLSKTQPVIKAFLPIKVDPETRRFMLETPEN